jgi:hypothetical protein
VQCLIVSRWIFGACLCVYSVGALAQSLDDALEGFGQTAQPVVENTNTGAKVDDKSTPSGEFSGSLSLASSYNYRDHVTQNGTDWQGLSKLRSRMNLQYDGDLSNDWKFRVAGYGFYDAAYSFRDRDNYSKAVLDDYEHEADWQEVWLRGKLREDLDIKVGRQVVIWGRADSLRVLDVLNPLDNREPGLTDIEDIRLPVSMIKTDWFFDKQWQASFIAIPEVRFSKNPPQGSDFAVALSPLYGGPMSLLSEEQPENFRDSSFAMSLNGTFSGWDLSLNAAQFWRDTPYLHVSGPYSLAVPVTALQQMEFRHSRVTMLGAGANLISGSWLFKTEAAFFDGIDYTLSAPTVLPGTGIVDLPSANTEGRRADILLGVEYFGFANTALALEMANRHVSDFESSMEPLYQQKDSLETAFRYTGNFINDQLELTALAVVFGESAQDGALIRLQAAYDLQDALVLTVGMVDYRYGDLPPFTSIENNDRIFAELKYSF